jgi:hypothetical protein
MALGTFFPAGLQAGPATMTARIRMPTAIVMVMEEELTDRTGNPWDMKLNLEYKVEVF